MALGAVIELPVYDKFMNPIRDQNGNVVTVKKVVMRDPRAMWREMTVIDPSLPHARSASPAGLGLFASRFPTEITPFAHSRADKRILEIAGLAEVFQDQSLHLGRKDISIAARVTSWKSPRAFALRIMSISRSPIAHGALVWFWV
jgi:hypothetical protein